MKAVLQNNPGNRETLFIGDAQKPSVKDNEVLVRVKATALNRMDIIQREGRYPLPDDASSILGVDMAGVVEDFGSSVTNWKKGDEVFGLLQGGGYAEYTNIAEGLLWRKPSHLSFEEAAAL
ncbi:MAG: alcohol dehydrogenase catalytic domain-containing protein, partial [Deltaproteobacteria bacterium]|nr:alcohol dehydrogenase catalytic domain-containing protein [Deltaproteobacteria bacterium]